MEVPAELTRLLAEFFIAALRKNTHEQRLRQPVQSVDLYIRRLQNAALITPLMVVQTAGEQRQFLYPMRLQFNLPEQDCLINAAYLLTGLVPC